MASKLYGVDATIIIFVVLLYCIVLYCIVLYCIVLYCIVLYCIRAPQFPALALYKVDFFLLL